MVTKVHIAHDESEEEQAEILAEPMRRAGYEVSHRGTVLIGDSYIAAASEVLKSGGPVVVCGTKMAVGSAKVHRIVDSARETPGRVLIVQMDGDAHVKIFSLGDVVASYYKGKTEAIDKLLATLKKYYPLDDTCSRSSQPDNAEQRYRELALNSWQIIDLPNLSDIARGIGMRPEELHLKCQQLYLPLQVMRDVTYVPKSDVTNPEGVERSQRALGRGESPITERRPVGECLDKGRVLVVLGDTGTGKSTMIRWLANAYLLKHGQHQQSLPHAETLPNEVWLPILIRCRELDSSFRWHSFSDLLLHTLEGFQIDKTEVELIKNFLFNRIKDGGVILLIDGLDEITDISTRKDFCEQIKRIHRTHNKVPIVVTSRSAGHKEIKNSIGDFEAVTVADLSKEDKKRFARNWCCLVEKPERRKEALRDIRRYIRSLERLTGNPMFLTTLALVNRNVRRLPRWRIDLYREAMLVMLNSRDGVKDPIDEREAFPQLEYLAYAMCELNVQQLPENEIIERLNRMRDEYDQIKALRDHTAEDFLYLLVRRTNILVEASQTHRTPMPVSHFKFRHLVYQEYFASLALIQGNYPRRNGETGLAETFASLVSREIVLPEPTCKHGNESRTDVIDEPEVREIWREVLRMCVPNLRVDERDNVLLAILNPLSAEDAAITSRPRAVLAALCLIDMPDVKDETVESVLREITRQIGPNDGSASIRTSLDAAAMDLAKSRYVMQFYDALKLEFNRRDELNDPTASNVLSLCGKVIAVLNEGKQFGE